MKAGWWKVRTGLEQSGGAKISDLRFSVCGIGWGMLSVAGLCRGMYLSEWTFLFSVIFLLIKWNEGLADSCPGWWWCTK